MLAIEKDLFEELMRCIDSSDKRLNENLEGKEKGNQKNELVVFNKDVDEFLDLDGNKVGPFEKGQMANMPKEISKILVDDGKAELMIE